MNIVEYLDAEKDIAALAALIRGNKLRWLEEISNTEIILDDESIKYRVLKMLKGYVDIKSGNCHPNEPDEYWSVWPDPDSFEFFYRAIIPEPVYIPLKHRCTSADLHSFSRGSRAAYPRACRYLQEKPCSFYGLDRV